MDRVSTGDNRRLIDIHHALVDLILALDPKHKYTPATTLKPIEIERAPCRRRSHRTHPSRR